MIVLILSRRFLKYSKYIKIERTVSELNDLVSFSLESDPDLWLPRMRTYLMLDYYFDFKILKFS